MKEKLQDIFREVFDDGGIVLERQMTADDIEAWDSLTHFEMVMEIERAFGIKFGTDEILCMESVGQIMDLVVKHTGDRA